MYTNIVLSFHSRVFFNYSEQQSVDCLGRDGCGGGDPVSAWVYIAANGGLATESAYPYTSGRTGTVI